MAIAASARSDCVAPEAHWRRLPLHGSCNRALGACVGSAPGQAGRLLRCRSSNDLLPLLCGTHGVLLVGAFLVGWLQGSRPLFLPPDFLTLQGPSSLVGFSSCCGFCFLLAGGHPVWLALVPALAAASQGGPSYMVGFSSCVELPRRFARPWCMRIGLRI